jgi:hypothetical protein
MTEKEYLKERKRLEKLQETLDDEIRVLNDRRVQSVLNELGVRDGEIVEIEEERSGAFVPTRKEWVRGCLIQIRVEEDDGTVRCNLGKLKKDGTTAKNGTVLYYVHLTGKMKQRIRKVSNGTLGKN